MVESLLKFGPYQLHPVQGLFRRGREVRVTPKSLAVLMALARQPGRIVTKQELFSTVWAGTIVTESALSSCIRELRRALDDDARDPRFIETVHRRGFRLLVNDTRHAPGRNSSVPPGMLHYDAMSLPGRTGVIEQLEKLAARIHDSGTEIALITGPSGIGKTALLRCMAARLSARGETLVCETTCTEPALAYGPLLEILGQLRQGPAGAAISSILRNRASSWLAELEYRKTGTREIPPECESGATTQWRIRKLSQTLAAVSEISPLVVCFDDLHRCDEATLEFILSVARDPGKSRMLLLASLEVEPPGQKGPCAEILQVLTKTGRGTEFKLDTLDERAVAECLRIHFSGIEAGQHDHMTEEVLRHSQGLPLMVEAELNLRTGFDPGKTPVSGRREKNAFTYQKSAVEARLSKLVGRYLDGLSETERRILEAASVVGERFSATAVGAATGNPLELVRDSLSQIQAEVPVILELGTQTLPGGSHECEFAFLHEEYRAAVYASLEGSRRIDMHRRVGHWIQKTWVSHSDEVAVHLARHFEQAGELDDAARHWYGAGAVARRRSVHGIALKNFRRSKILLDDLTRSPVRDLQMAKICTALGRELVVTEGLDSPEANSLYDQALDLSMRIPASRELSQVLWRLWVFHLNRGPMKTAGEIANRLLDLAQRLDDPILLVQAHHAQWGTSFMLGDLKSVLEHTRAAIAVCGSGVNGSLTLTTGCTLHDAHLSDHNVAVCAGFFSAWVNAIAGRKELAISSLDAVVAHARDIRHPFTLALTLVFAAGALATSGNPGLTRLRAAEGGAIAQRHGFAALSAWAAIYEGWSLVELGDTDEGMELLQNGLAAVGQFGMTLLRPFHLVLAAMAQMRCGRLDDAIASLAEAFAGSESSGHRVALSEMHRLRGEITLRITDDQDSRRRAISDLESAAKIADSTGAHLWARRAKAALAEQSELVRVTSRRETGLA